MRKIKFTLILFLIGAVTHAQNVQKYGIDTEGEIPKGLKVGDKAPGFQAKNQHEQTVKLQEILKDQKVVVIFYRGYWCPVCSKYLKNYRDSLKHITQKGARVIAVTPEKQQGVQKTIDKTDAEFDILSDTHGQIMASYGVDFKVTEKYKKKIKTFRRADIAENNNQKEARLPVPATFVIGQDGIIDFVQFNHNYKQRASIKSILQAL